MRTRWLIIGILVVVWIATGTPCVHAADAARTLTIEECRRLALEKNLSFRVSRLSPSMSQTRVDAALSSFDPYLTANVSGSRTQQPNSLTYDPTTQTYKTTTYPPQNSIGASVGAEKKFAFGTTMGLDLYNNWFKGSGQSNYSSRLAFGVSQPLLRGFGKDVNESAIRIARNSLDISVSRLEDDAIGTIGQVEEAYWNLVYAIEGMKVAQLSLQQAQRLLERSRARAETGAQARREVIEAEVGAAQAQQGIISAEGAIRTAEDRLKLLTNLAETGEGWGLAIATVDTPHIAAELPPVDQLTATALRNSRQVYQAEKTLESRALTARVRRNALMPTLDLAADVTLRDGDPRNWGKGIDDIPVMAYPSWSAGLRLALPLGNRSAEADYRQALLDIRSAELQLDAARQQVYADVRAAVRQIETTRLQIAAAAETRRLQEAYLENQQERLRLGLATNYDVLRVEKDLADARRSYLNARIEHEKALLALDMAMGRLLVSRGIVIEGDAITN